MVNKRDRFDSLLGRIVAKQGCRLPSQPTAGPRARSLHGVAGQDLEPRGQPMMLAEAYKMAEGWQAFGGSHTA